MTSLRRLVIGSKALATDWANLGINEFKVQHWIGQILPATLETLHIRKTWRHGPKVEDRDEQLMTFMHDVRFKRVWLIRLSDGYALMEDFEVGLELSDWTFARRQSGRQVLIRWERAPSAWTYLRDRAEEVPVGGLPDDEEAYGWYSRFGSPISTVDRGEAPWTTV